MADVGHVLVTRATVSKQHITPKTLAVQVNTAIPNWVPTRLHLALLNPHPGLQPWGQDLTRPGFWEPQSTQQL